MIMREKYIVINEDTKALISYPIQWETMIHKPKFVLLDLVVTKYYICIHEGKKIRTYRYGKCETIENDLGKKVSWRETVPKVE